MFINNSFIAILDGFHEIDIIIYTFEFFLEKLCINLFICSYAVAGTLKLAFQETSVLMQENSHLQIMQNSMAPKENPSWNCLVLTLLLIF